MLTINQLIRAYEEARLVTCSNETARSYKRVFLALQKSFGEKEAASLSKKDWMKPFEERGAGARKQAAIILRALANFGDLKGPDIPRTKTTPHRRLTDEEVARLLETKSEASPIIEIAMATGLRISDAAKLASNKKSMQEFLCSKGGTAIPVPKQTWGDSTIQSYSGWYRAFKRHAKKSGVDASFHSLRKTVACIAAEEGASDAEIMAVLGHKTPRMAAYYRAQADRLSLAQRGQQRVKDALSRRVANHS